VADQVERKHDDAAAGKFKGERAFCVSFVVLVAVQREDGRQPAIARQTGRLIQLARQGAAPPGHADAPHIKPTEVGFDQSRHGRIRRALSPQGRRIVRRSTTRLMPFVSRASRTA
jgi:hypothetical protein